MNLKSLPKSLSLTSVLLLLASAPCVQATPYATSLTNNAGTVSFRLNEAADQVTIIGNGGTLSTNLGPKSAGLTVTNLSAKGLTAGTIQVVVRKTGLNAITGIATNFMNSPRGLAVNTRPASPYFGRVYVANSAAGGTPARGDGVYLYYPNLTDDNAGSTTNLQTGGYDFGIGGTSAPFHLSVAPNDEVYIGDWSDAKPGLIATDPNVSTYWYVLGQAQANAATGIIGDLPVGIGADGRTNNHGSVQAVVVTGSTNTGDLKVFTIDEDYATDPESVTLSQRNALWEYDIGSGPLPWTNPPNKLLMVPNINFLSQNDDLALGPNGYLYFNQSRQNASLTTWSPSFYVVDPNTYIDPTNYSAFYDPAVTNWSGFQSNIYAHASQAVGGYIWESQTATRVVTGGVDVFAACNGISVSPDGKYIAGMTITANLIIMAPLTNGIPDVSRLFTFNPGTTASGRSVAWDAADNFYLASSGLATVRAYSLGFSSTATSGSDGTFSLAVPPNEVWVTATDGVATEGTPATDTATFTFYRSGDTTLPLTLTNTVAGTSANGTDYTNILGGNVGTTITFAAGASSTNVTIVAIDDATTELTETVILTIVASTNYTSLSSKAATAVIADNELPEISLAANGVNTNMYERVANDFTRFTLTRRGITNATFSVNLGYSGLVNGTDLTGPSSVSLNPGTVTVNFDLNPLDDAAVSADLRPFSVAVLAASAGEYVPNATTNTAFGNIINDDLPAETVLWSDNFDANVGVGFNTLPANWTFTFGTTNTASNPSDYDFDFGYDYSALGIPAAPGAVTTTGLRATVNKHLLGLAGAGWAAGINFYPTNIPTFTNDYALRFNMLMVVDSTSNQTEHATFGINHSGTTTNWFSSSSTVLNGNLQDGLWCSVNSVGGGANDFCLFTKGTSATAPLAVSNRLATTMTHVFKTAPYFGAGMPGINQTALTPTWTWLDVELAQTTNMIVLRINNSVVIQTTNITAFKSGTIMLGYNDAFNSIGGMLPGAVIYDNARVVTIAPPVIVTQPASTVAAQGSAAGFSVVATTGTGVTNYQWSINGANIVGATNAALNFATVQFTNYGTYQVVVNDGRFPVVSATTTLLPPAAGLVINTQPVGKVVPFGLTTSLSVVASSSSGTTNYQWMMSSTNVSGANYTGITGRSLGITSVQFTNAGPYKVRVSDGFTSITSDVVNVTIAIQPAITSLASGSTLNLTFPTEVGPNYVVEWKGALTNGAWNPLVTNAGTGSPITVPESTLVAAERYYRVRMQ